MTYHIFGDAKEFLVMHPYLYKVFFLGEKSEKSEHMLDMYRRLDHMRWLRFYTFYNWSYGAMRNDFAREHPMLCDYQELNWEQKRERDAAWELLGSMKEELGNCFKAV